MRFFVVLALALSVSVSAFADQCSWNDRGTAQVARGYLAFHMGPVYSYCEPCGDRVMQSIHYGQDKEDTRDGRAVHFRWQDRTPPSAGQVGYQFAFNEGLSITENGRERSIERKVDLAYLYVKTPAGGFYNVGVLFQCTNNSYWNPERARNFRGLPQEVTPYILPNTVPVNNDVTENDFMRAYEQKYPNDPRG